MPHLSVNTALSVHHNLTDSPPPKTFFIDMNNINKNDPFEVLMDAEFYARARSWSIREINRAKSVGSKKVKLTVMEESCPKSVKVKKTYNIDDVPLLPLKTCGHRCLCMYTAVIEF